MEVEIAAGLIAAYLIGSVPTAVWLGKYFFGIDVRTKGSGNSGATNAMRVFGKKAGIGVLIIDIFKGITAVSLAYIFSPDVSGSYDFIFFQQMLGMAAVIGHIFPVFAGFRGGKGIATLLGFMLITNTYAAVVAIVCFLLMLLFFRIVSLASIFGAVFFSASLIIYFTNFGEITVPFSLLIVVLVIITHQKNIQRLIRGEESKVRIF
jgi:acyl phosphate:glycerol-3-phosphate acyltransferase